VTTTRSATPHLLSADQIERVSWAELGPDFIRSWGRPNGRVEPEHLTVYGKSGGGKTHFVVTVLKERAAARGSHVVTVATKPADRTLVRTGWPITDTWPPGYKEHQVIYWAKPKGISAEGRANQRRKVYDLMNRLWVKDSNIIVFWDELTYIEKNLRLKDQIEMYYREGRSMGITNVASMQRPAYVSRLAHSESGWTVAFPPKDVDDRDRVSEVLGNRALYRDVLDGLDRTKHEFLIKHDLTGQAYISHLPRPRSAAAKRGVSSRGSGGVASSGRDHPSERHR
jgi:hypothetical protein